jgi:glucokinase
MKPYKVISMKYLVFDIGGTAVKSALVENGGIIERKTAATPLVYADLLKELQGDICHFKPAAVVCSIPGVYNKALDRVLFAPNIAYLNGRRLAADIDASVPVFVENDANMAALGEYHHGFKEAVSSLLFLTLGTGVGGGLVMDGKLVTGNITLFEPGHITVAIKGRLCGCGKRGCLERYCTVQGILMNYIEAGGTEGLLLADVVRLAGEGDKAAAAAFEEFALSLAHGIAGLINLYAPQHIRIGGGLSELSYLYFDRLKALSEELTFPAFRGAATLDAAALKNDAALLGGAKWAESNAMI